MTTILTKVQQFLTSDNIEAARDEVAKSLHGLNEVNSSILNFATLLALGSEKALEIGLGVLGRKLLKKDVGVDDNTIWLLLAAVLSRPSITSNSLSRISILGLTSHVSNWELPIFALLTPALDSFLKVSLAEGTPLIAEQTLDFLSTWGESYAKVMRTREQLKEIEHVAQSVLEQIEELELKDEWSEGLNRFFQIARIAPNKRYLDQRIWSSASDLLKKIYNTQVLNIDTASQDYYQVRTNIFRLITSSLAALGAISHDRGLSIAVRIDSCEENKPWAVIATAIDKIERLFQEIADSLDTNRSNLPTFIPAQAIPGSWTLILHMDLSSNQSISLATAIKSLLEADSDLTLANSWRDCVAKLKEDNLRVDLAVSTNAPELYLVRSVSTEDIPKSEDSLQPNIRVLSVDIPQANSLERVLDYASLLIQYPSSSSTLRQNFLEIDGTTERDFYYYKRATKILGLADDREQPTTACYVINRLSSTDAKIKLLAYQFMSSQVGSAWFNWQNVHDFSEIQPERAYEFLTEICPSLAEATIKRRAVTLENWLRRFLVYW